MVETRSSSKSDSRLTPSKTKQRKQTATASTQGPKKKKRTSAKPNLITESDLVGEHYALLCAREYRDAHEGRYPSMEFMKEKQAEFLKLDEDKQLEITEKYKAERKKNKNKLIVEPDFLLIPGPVTELSLVQVYYAERYRKKYVADNGGKAPPTEELNEKQLEFRNMASEEQEKIRKEYLADKKKR